MDIAKPCTHLHPVPFTFPQLHPAPPTFTHPHPAYFSLHLALCSILNFMRTKMSRVIGQFLQIQAEKIQSCLFFLKIGTHGILEVLIPNPWLDFWNSNPKIHFLANLQWKSQNCCFASKLTHLVPPGCWFLFWY